VLTSSLGCAVPSGCGGDVLRSVPKPIARPPGPTPRAKLPRLISPWRPCGARASPIWLLCAQSHALASSRIRSAHAGASRTCECRASSQQRTPSYIARYMLRRPPQTRAFMTESKKAVASSTSPSSPPAPRQSPRSRPQRSVRHRATRHSPIRLGALDEARGSRSARGSPPRRRARARANSPPRPWRMAGCMWSSP
jgi:hypothetical protein